MKPEFITILQQFHKTVADRRDTRAVIIEDSAYTWEELDILSDKLALQLLADNISKGSHIALCGRNSPEWICAFLSILKTAAIPVLMNPRLKEAELITLLEYSEVGYIFSDEALSLPLSGEMSNKTVSLGSGLLEVLKQTSPLTYSDRRKLSLKQMEIYPDDMACMLFTSGTTSRPKGVLLSHYQLINIARETVDVMKWTEEDRVCLALPMFHCFGLSAGLLSSFVHGGSLCLTNGHKTSTVMECIEKNRCTVFNSVPSLFLAIIYNRDRAKYNLTSLRSGIIAGSDVHTNDFLLIVKELGMEGLMQSYGQTEASPSLTFTAYEDSLELRSRSVGKKISNIELKLVDLDTSLELPTGRSGEILIKGYNVMKGYYKNEEETREAITLDGWLKTGDIGQLDEEGNLYITGRKKDIIIRCGENISPKEIEETILLHENVEQVKVFGIPQPVVQEEIAACIVAKSGEITPEEMKDYLVDKLADYKIPKFILTYDNFPANANGKIDLQTLKKDAQQKIHEM